MTPTRRPAMEHDVAIVSFAQSTSVDDHRSEPELLLPVIRDACDAVGLLTQDMGFVVSGSSDYLAGRPFSFVSALDAIGAWPPLTESHVEMDGAFALYEAVLRLQHGDIDTALVYSFGVSSMSDVARTVALQLDPYHVAPLMPDAHALAGLQARALLDSGRVTERDVAEVLARCLRDAGHNDHAIRFMDIAVEDVLAQPRPMDPLRDLDVPPVTDGCAVMILATAEKALELTDTPVFITGIDHRIEAHGLGVRDLTTSVSTRQAAQAAGALGRRVDLAELHAVTPHQELILRAALELDAATVVNPSGGALVANPFMSAGLIRIGEAASRIMSGEGRSAIAHASSGPLLQQNLVTVLEAA